jgi:hypothetical protein
VAGADARGIEILLCTRGAGRIHGSDRHEVARGDSFVVPAAAAAVHGARRSHALPRDGRHRVRRLGRLHSRSGCDRERDDRVRAGSARRPTPSSIPRSGRATALRFQRAIARKTANYLYLQPVDLRARESRGDRPRDAALRARADRYDRAVIAMDPSKPLFRVKRAPRLNFASLYFQPSRNWRSTRDAIAVATANSEPTELEIQDAFIDSSMLSFAVPADTASELRDHAGGQARARVDRSSRCRRADLRR